MKKNHANPLVSLPLFSLHPSEGNSSHAGSAAIPAIPDPASGPLEEGPDSQNLIWRVQLGDRIGPDELLINISTNQLLTEGEGLFSSEVGPMEMDFSGLVQGRPFPLNGTLEFTLGRRRNDSGDVFYHNRTLLTSLRGTIRSNRTR